MAKKIRFPKVRKEIKDFLFDEEGRISKGNIIKIGVSVAVLKMMFSPDDAHAAHVSSPAHNSQLVPGPNNRGGHSSDMSNHSSGHASGCSGFSW